LEIIVATAAFNVTTTDRHNRADDTVLGREQRRITAQRRALLRRHQRVVAVDEARVAEVTRRRDQRVRVVVHEHDFHVRLEGRADLVISKGAERVALVRTLEVVVRREVEERRTRYELVAYHVAGLHLSAGRGVELAEGAGVGGRRTTAII